MNYRFSVAPMMDWTDRHCRVLHRLLSPHALLYTEMVTADAILFGNRDRLIGFSDVEHPVALQLGGSDPAKLAQAAKIGEEFGYDEINLNVGCPSERVQSGSFGACLMREPELVADCMAAMGAVVKIPVTVKCRIGVDEQEPDIALRALVAACAKSGVRTFIIHARKAMLAGLSPKQNRDVPPLNYELAYALKRENPDLTIVLNGGITSIDACEEHLKHLDGVMLGRAAYQTPAILVEAERRIFGGEADITRAVDAYTDYVAACTAQGIPLHDITRHMLGLFNGQPGARFFRRFLSENATRRGANVDTLREALSCLGGRERDTEQTNAA